MKRYITLLSLSTLFMLCAGRTYSQEKPQDNKKAQHKFYKEALGVDSVKAEMVVQIQDNYKAAMNEVGASQSLSQEEKTEKYKALIENKNRKLAAMLTPRQQEEIIPAEERSSLKPEKKN